MTSAAASASHVAISCGKLSATEVDELASADTDSDADVDVSADPAHGPS